MKLASCCAAAGALSCPREWVVVGADSRIVVDGTSARVTGLWTHRCSGAASWDPAASIGVSPPPSPGSVLTPLSSAAAACFAQACALPAGRCLQTGGSRISLQPCAGAGAVSFAGPSPAPVPRAAPRPELPPAPPEPCVPNPALRQPSNDQVDAGNAAVVAGDLDEAVKRYRAALAINTCNAFGWTALGDVWLQLGDPESARAALTVATRLMPTHFHAWTALGQAEERIGDRGAARRAYQQALVANPNHEPARSGLARLGG